ncbi:MAG: phage head closure protein [Sphingobacteriaceae bacterium]|nr:phage head closure protein [Sphingobacteriaceae bacterium]
MNGGSLTKKVKFFEYSYQPDDAGGQIATPVTVLETFGKVKSITSSKTLEALKEGLNQAFELRIRMRKGFTPKSHYSIEYKGREMVILKVISDEESSKEWIIIIANRES